MKALAIILNFFFPGIGSFFVGKFGQGIVQIILYVIGWLLIFTIWGMLIGIPLCVVVWVWGLITAATANPQPVRVEVVHVAAAGAAAAHCRQCGSALTSGDRFCGECGASV